MSPAANLSSDTRPARQVGGRVRGWAGVPQGGSACWPVGVVAGPRKNCPQLPAAAAPLDECMVCLC